MKAITSPAPASKNSLKYSAPSGLSRRPRRDDHLGQLGEGRAAQADPKLRLLGGLPALRACPTRELQLIARITEVLDRPAGTRVSTYGRPLTGLWCLLAGIAVATDDHSATLLARSAISPVDTQLRARLTVHALTSVRILEVATHDLRRWDVPALQAMLLGTHGA